MVEEELAQRREEITFPLEGRVYKDSGRDGRGLCTCKAEEWGLGRRAGGQAGGWAVDHSHPIPGAAEAEVQPAS